MTSKSYDRHHIVPTSRWGTDIQDNIVRLDIRHHRALHLLFDNRVPPKQIERLMEINITALTDEFKEDVYKILRQAKDPEYVFKQGILVQK